MEQRPGEISPGPLLHRFFLGRGGSAVMFKLRLLCYRIIQEKKPRFQFRTMRMLRRFCSLCLQTIWNWKDGRKGCFTVKLKLVFPALLAFVLSAVPAGAEAPFHIGIMTGTVSQSEDSLRGAELMLERYGNSSEGGMITHVTYPDNFMSEMEVTIGQLVGLADDPKMKAIVVNQAGRFYPTIYPQFG